MRFAPLGLAAMFNPGGAVLSSRLQPAADAAPSGAGRDEEAQQDSSPKASVAAQLDVRGVGRLLCYCSRRPLECRVEGLPVKFAWEQGALTLQLSRGESTRREVLVLW